jgi:hypothetical protein
MSICISNKHKEKDLETPDIDRQQTLFNHLTYKL